MDVLGCGKTKYLSRGEFLTLLAVSVSHGAHGTSVGLAHAIILLSLLCPGFTALSMFLFSVTIEYIFRVRGQPVTVYPEFKTACWVPGISKEPPMGQIPGQSWSISCVCQ